MTFTPEQTRVAKRQDLLESIFAGLRQHLGQGFEHLQINRVVLFNVVVSYFDDVNRHKHFHGTERIDPTKQAAYTMKWIAKLRPIQFSLPNPDDATKEILYINEIFAVRCGLAFMELTPQDLPDVIYVDALYTIRYRHLDERLLILWLATLQSAINGTIGHNHQPST